MLGVALRAAVVMPLGDDASAVVIATVVINIVGSAALGVVVGLIADRAPLVRAFFGTGVMGGFTTYSAFAVHTVQTAGSAGLWSLTLVGVSVAGGVLAAVLGLWVGRRRSGQRDTFDLPEDAE